ncbi:unnamed protein product [Schistosoma curassoni]|uniref:Uncharacterized protein n=1 Tax=Schistosoma curassoni TaxID=6186 RepID=A0A183JQ17_9TREM|nr:unnamed protein product [Schistosoma curassoni]
MVDKQPPDTILSITQNLDCQKNLPRQLHIGLSLRLIC